MWDMLNTASISVTEGLSTSEYVYRQLLDVSRASVIDEVREWTAQIGRDRRWLSNFTFSPRPPSLTIHVEYDSKDNTHQQVSNCRSSITKPIGTIAGIPYS